MSVSKKSLFARRAERRDNVSDVIGALLYLRVESFRNALRSRLQRLKQPKYLVGAIVGVGYFYFVFFRQNRGGRRGAAQLAAAFPLEQLPTVVTLSAVLLMILLALYWIMPRSRAALSFTEAEIAFLFPAPINRRTLVHYRLINLQIGLILTSVILGVLSRGWSFLSGGAAIRFIGWWIVFATLTLHSIGSSFVITRLLDRGVTSRSRRLLALGAIVVILVAASLWVWSKWRAPADQDLVDLGAFANYFATMCSFAPLSWLLAPAKWVVGPILAPDWVSFLTALGPALLIYAIHYVWVLQSEVSFEEASIAKAEKRAARIAAFRSGKGRVGFSAPKARRPPFNLARVTRPEFAFLWKNLIASAKYLRPRTALIAATVIIVGCSWLNRPGHEVLAPTIAMFALIVAGYTLLFGPMVARQDLRTDLLNADILKTYPLRGWQIVLGEMLTPVAIITVVLWLLLLTASMLMMSLPFKLPTWAVELRVPGTIALCLLAPLLCAIEVLVMNTAVVLFPAWLQTSQGRAGGIEVMGQRILFVAGLFIAIVVAL